MVTEHVKEKWMEIIKAEKTVVYRFRWDFLNTNMYVMKEGNELLVVDPVDAGEFWDFLDHADIASVSALLTHEHFDHINGLNRLRKNRKCMVYAHSRCSTNIGDIRKNLSGMANIIAEFSGTANLAGRHFRPYKCAPADIVFEEKYTFAWQGHRIKLIATPGHSPGSICIVIDDRLLFSGDSLLRIPVITRFPGGNTEQYQRIAMPRIKELLGQVGYVFSGHEEGGTPEEMLL